MFVFFKVIWNALFSFAVGVNLHSWAFQMYRKPIKLCTLVVAFFSLLLFFGCKKEFSSESKSANPIYNPFGIVNPVVTSYGISAHYLDNDGSLIFLSINGSTVNVIKTDPRGNVIFKKVLLDSMIFACNSITKMTDGNFLMVGCATDGIAPFRSIILITDPGFNLLKTLWWNPAPAETGYTSYDIPNVIEDGTGGYFMTVNVDYKNAVDQPYFIHYNAHDSIDLAFHSGLNEDRRDLIFSAYKLNGEFICVTNRFGSSDFYLQKINESMLYQKKVETLSSKKIVVGNNPKKSNGWNYASVLVKDHLYLFDFDLESFNNASAITAINFYSLDVVSGDVVKKSFPINQPVTFKYNFVNKPLFKDGYLYFSYNNSYNNYLVKASSEGDFQWIKTIGGDVSRDEGDKLLSMGNELWFFGRGTLTHSKVSSIYLAKYDLNGELIKK